MPKALRYVCERCDLKAPAPIVCAVANPKNADHGRCSNREACESRVRRWQDRIDQPTTDFS
jgi:hypothetical protein